MEWMELDGSAGGGGWINTQIASTGDGGAGTQKELSICWWWKLVQLPILV